MITIKKFVFNPFQENTYLLYDETGECLIVDPGCHEKFEQKELTEFIRLHHLKPVKQIYTHCHVDHILGNAFVYKTYGLKPAMHKDSLPIFKDAPGHALIYGIEDCEIVDDVEYLSEGALDFGRSKLEILHTPGHVDGHLCFVDHEGKSVISGDVLFKDSIGRTDLPTGDFETLAESIRNKLYTLGSGYAVYPGHGPETTIGYERQNNPFVSA